MAYGQVWGTCELLGPNGAVQRRVTSFAAQYVAGRVFRERSNQHADYWHPGFAWMATRKALEATGGLICRTLGSADRHMAMAFLGRAAETMPNLIHKNYKQQVMNWQDAVQHNGIELVVVPGLIRHYWHGSLEHRKYEGRWNILLEHDFDPALHIVQYTGTDLYVWSSHCPSELILAVIQYFQDRQEDSIQVEADDVVADVDVIVADAITPTTTTMTGDDQDGGAIPIVSAVAAESFVASTVASTVTDAFSFYA